MNIASVLSPQDIVLDADAACARQALRVVGDHMQKQYGYNARILSHALISREKLGSTALGDGVALPHACVAKVEEPTALFVRLSDGVSFDAQDERLVDLLFVLLVPEEGRASHMKLIARISRLLRDATNLEELRREQDTAALYAILRRCDT